MCGITSEALEVDVDCVDSVEENVELLEDNFDEVNTTREDEELVELVKLVVDNGSDAVVRLEVLFRDLVGFGARESSSCEVVLDATEEELPAIADAVRELLRLRVVLADLLEVDGAAVLDEVGAACDEQVCATCSVSRDACANEPTGLTRSIDA